MATDSRASNRLRAAEAGRVLDAAARERRLRKQLDALDMDNFHEDPHANLQVHKARPKFDEDMTPGAASTSSGKRTADKQTPTGGSVKKKKRLMKEHNKQRFRKTFQQLLEEELLTRPKPNYESARVPPSRLPPRHFCAVCGFFSNYTCIQCGARYCRIKCLETHKDTRCLKWTV